MLTEDCRWVYPLYRYVMPPRNDLAEILDHRGASRNQCVKSTRASICQSEKIQALSAPDNLVGGVRKDQPDQIAEYGLGLATQKRGEVCLNVPHGTMRGEKCSH